MKQVPKSKKDSKKTCGRYTDRSLPTEYSVCGNTDGYVVGTYLPTYHTMTWTNPSLKVKLCLNVDSYVGKPI